MPQKTFSAGFVHWGMFYCGDVRQYFGERMETNSADEEVKKGMFRVF